jgi:hypothetical protein
MMVGRSLFVSALALASLWGPQVLKAQAATPSAAPAGAPQAALNVARNDYNVEIARLHEVQAKAEAMDNFGLHVEEILAEHGTTREAYLQELFAITSDTAQREVFEKLLREMKAR